MHKELVQWNVHCSMFIQPQKKKKNETMPFATTWMDLEITTVSEASQTKILLTCGI